MEYILSAQNLEKMLLARVRVRVRVRGRARVRFRDRVRDSANNGVMVMD